MMSRSFDLKIYARRSLFLPTLSRAVDPLDRSREPGTRARGGRINYRVTREYSATQRPPAESCEILMHNFPPFYSDVRLHARTCTRERKRLCAFLSVYTIPSIRVGWKRALTRVHALACASFNANFPTQNPVNHAATLYANLASSCRREPATMCLRMLLLLLLLLLSPQIDSSVRLYWREAYLHRDKSTISAGCWSSEYRKVLTFSQEKSERRREEEEERISFRYNSPHFRHSKLECFERDLIHYSSLIRF